ncbi:MAG TPA: multicopper oxidase domain-containing protein [Euzebyales bacterium]|nr:multicopper oxidase domain-containing protein [Euzebyales bacterium]
MDTADRAWRALALSLAVFLVLVLLLAFEPPPAQTAEPAAAAGDAHVVAVELTEFAIAPAEITVPAGVPVTFEVTNSGAIEHDFTVEGVDGTAAIAGGATATLEVAPFEPGEYRVVCTVAGHEPAGMHATLVADEGAQPADGAGSQPDAGAHGDGTADAQAGEDGHPMSPEEMARMHEQGVLDFPVASEGKGNQPLEPEVADDGTKVFALTADEIEWETKPGVVKQGMAYNGQIPGPRIEVDLGDRVRIELTNELDEPTAMHSHGLIVPNDMDGVPGLNQPSIMPGETFTYEFEVRNSGSHMYHSHFNAAEQVTQGLLGAFIVHDPDDQEVDLDYTMIVNDGPLGFTLNGKDFPATEPLVVDKGDTVRIRYMNEGLQIHPMHLHGLPQKVVARDGWPLEQPQMMDTVLVAPGERIDVIVEATEVGPWAFHCHILTHAEAEDGMFGMVTALVVEDA